MLQGEQLVLQAQQLMLQALQHNFPLGIKSFLLREE